ncbi:MAG: hypothetical protein U5K00_24545 [Melioribacteraceae bacterium]|nr:hypothetical protein [Melioribacteraceae bacterium]
MESCITYLMPVIQNRLVLIFRRYEVIIKTEDGGRRNNSDYENLGGVLKVGVNDFYNFNLAYSLMIVENEGSSDRCLHDHVPDIGVTPSGIKQQTT